MKVPKEIGTKHQKGPRQAKGGQTRGVIAKSLVLEISKRGEERGKNGGKDFYKSILTKYPELFFLKEEVGTSTLFPPFNSISPNQQRGKEEWTCWKDGDKEPIPLL